MLLVGKIHQNPAKQDLIFPKRNIEPDFSPRNDFRKIHGRCILKQNFHILTEGSNRYMFQEGVSQIEPKNSLPIGCMYGIFTYIYHKNQPHVGKYTSPMDGMGWVRSEHPHSIGFGVKHIGHIHMKNVAFRRGRMDATLQQGNEDKHMGTHRPTGWQPEKSSSTQKCQTGKRSYSSREVQFRLYCAFKKKGQGLDTFRLYPKNTHTWILCLRYLEKNGWIKLISGI